MRATREKNVVMKIVEKKSKNKSKKWLSVSHEFEIFQHEGNGLATKKRNTDLLKWQLLHVTARIIDFCFVRQIFRCGFYLFFFFFSLIQYFIRIILIHSIRVQHGRMVMVARAHRRFMLCNVVGTREREPENKHTYICDHIN